MTVAQRTQRRGTKGAVMQVVLTYQELGCFGDLHAEILMQTVHGCVESSDNDYYGRADS